MNTLSPQDLEQARIGNAYWSSKLGPHPLMPDGPTPASMAAVAAKQTDLELPVDGVLSPETRARLEGTRWQPPWDDRLLMGGQTVALPSGVRAVSCLAPEGLVLTDVAGTHKKRERPPGKELELVVLHWDECPSSLACFHTLLRRQLSAHLLVDADGTVWQTLDLLEACAFHARTHNPRSVGIEIQNALGPRPNSHGSTELICEAQAHSGRMWHITPFSAAQHRTIGQLVPWLCDVLGVPRAMPWASGAIATGLIDPSFRGVVGHFHLQQDKVDPGMSVWPSLHPALERRSV